jgi:hypothetical protein
MAALVGSWIAQALVLALALMALGIHAIPDKSGSLKSVFGNIAFTLIFFIPRMAILFWPTAILLSRSRWHSALHFVALGMAIGVIGVAFDILWSIPFAGSFYRIQGFHDVFIMVAQSLQVQRVDFLAILGGAAAGYSYWFILNSIRAKDHLS